ncbi:glycosyltransferase family 4 protein [Fretibacter rubidus]|uniref:glycosyltransferase family 4 protein n=1 Tax=Fretibacter rubidus TaxID=570162 RepID=UPI00352A9344
MDGLGSFVLLIFPSLVAGFTATIIALNMGLTDVSNARSSHSGTALTSGGVSIVAAFVAMMGVQYFMGPRGVFTPSYIGLIVLTLAIAALGLYDDLKGARSRPKLVFMVVVAICASVFLGPIKSFILPLLGVVTLPYIVGLAVSVLWIVVVMNAVNFIDGANGMLVGTMSVAAIGLLILTGGFTNSATYWALALLLGLICFAPFNLRHKAVIFAGDVGALTAGFIIAISSLWIMQNLQNVNIVFIMPLLILPILIDVFMTLIRRARAGENLMQAHNQHLFQRQIQAGASHLRVSFGYALASTLTTAVAILGIYQAWPTFEIFVIAVVNGVIIYIPLYRRAMAAISRAS